MRRLLLVTASSGRMQAIRRSRVIHFQQCTMPYLAALTPPGWDIEHVDEEVEEVDFTRHYDLVGITFHTPSAPHAYALADRLRDRGTPVVLGGPHVTLLPDEAERHADAIFTGEVEDTWPRFLREFEEGRHAKRYACGTPPSLVGVPQSRKDLFHRKDHSGGIMFATRGCPSKCEFCSIIEMYRGGLRRRPVEEVAAEYGSFSGKVIIFWDDNIAADIEYSKELFRAITPHRKWWSSQASIHAGRDDEFLALAARSGCKQLFLGLESVSQRSLNLAHKSFNRVKDYRDIVRNIQSHGIAVQVGVVFGFDEDQTDVFADTLEFLEDAAVQNATFNILTPYPGTPLFRRLDAEGRITTYDWSRYNARADVVFVPRRMTAQELLDGFTWINDRFYSPRSIARRLSKSPTGLYWTLPLNLRYLYAWRKHGAARLDGTARLHAADRS
ncbi:B12-binding domain-containing radical SAM protein [Dactylosporangium sp. CA-092794]|uniref:B12-binding domain-containing radical SAM protein n=1 Tax=Dactylosporangium sp. CA-092794 TaxID=3239929 RepID=UPI003D8DCAB5